MSTLIFLMIVGCILHYYSSEHITQTIPENSFNDNASTPPWMGEALKDIAYYLRAHKFNEYDRRYQTNEKLAQREYYKQFPRPPLRSLHWEVHKYCEESFTECVNYLRKRIKDSILKRIDDTSVVIQEQKWNQQNNSQQIEIVDAECRKSKELDDRNGDPFEGPLERFQWRVTASYFLCWYTMKSEGLLVDLGDKCDNFANCLERSLGPNNLDFRGRDTDPFACALYSFCPDPCCPFKYLRDREKCWDNQENPCFEGNPQGKRNCVFERSNNVEFRDIVLNRWNVTCSCPNKGYKWSSFYGICIDINECSSGENNCNPKTETCHNLPGSYKCVCKWGHKFDKSSKKCKESSAVRHLVLNTQKEENENKENVSGWLKFFRWFERSSSAKNDHSCSFVLISIILVSLSCFHEY